MLCSMASVLALSEQGDAADANIDGAGSSGNEFCEETSGGGQGSYMNPSLSSANVAIVSHMLDANGAIDCRPAQEEGGPTG